MENTRNIERRHIEGDNFVMAQIHFNRIYIIESLQHGDTLTGTNLHNDLLRFQSLKHPDFKSILRNPKDKKEWNDLFAEIKKDCEGNGNAPIIHFEVHGSSCKNGLVLTSKELITWEELYQSLAPINKILQNELFITMAVCHGSFFLMSSYINRQTAFQGIVGSFDEITESDLVIRYDAFYSELFSSFDLNRAYERLAASNPNMPNTYRCFSAEYVFARCYLEYIKNECSEAALEKRAKETIVEQKMLLNRHDRRKFIHDFIKTEQKNRDRYFKQDYETYFMLDIYPELKNSIGFKDNIADMKRWYNALR